MTKHYLYSNWRTLFAELGYYSVLRNTANHCQSILEKSPNEHPNFRSKVSNFLEIFPGNSELEEVDGCILRVFRKDSWKYTIKMMSPNYIITWLSLSGGIWIYNIFYLRLAAELLQLDFIQTVFILHNQIFHLYNIMVTKLILSMVFFIRFFTNGSFQMWIYSSFTTNQQKLPSVW